MKRTKKILSIVLAVLVAFGSMPMVYTATAASDAVTFAASDKGTLDNPTRPVAASGVLEREDLYKMNINSQSTSYTFYQTKNDEYFTYGQTQGLQHYYETSVSSRTLTFESIGFYEGASEMNGSTDPIEVSAGFGRWESPLITTNTTSDFLANYFVSNKWKSTNGNADGIGSEPKNFVLAGAWTDIGGCKVYTWQNDVIFKGNSADVTGEINTGYYEQLKWNWVTSEASAAFDLRIGTTIRVLDARELAKEIAEAESILENPDNYTTAYISSVEATLNTIPDDLRNFSAVYDQSVIDSYTKLLEDVSLNSADYTEYNKVYKSLKGISNEKGAFTDESFEAFKAEINRINTNLPKNLDKTKQTTVNAATQALRDAYNLLVATDVSKTEDSYYFQGTDNSGNVDITVKNVNLKFMQTKDNQQFAFTQSWILNRTGGSNKRIIYRVTIDDTYPLYCGETSCQSIPSITENKTSEFLARMSSGYTTLTADDANGTSFTAKEFTTWASDDGLVSNGMFNHEVGLEEKSYTATVTPTFVGNSATESGEITSNFVQRIGYKYYTGLFQYKYRHFHVNSTVTVTDVRQLIGAVEDAKETLNNPGTHSEGYITALAAAVDSVPVELLRGVEYYTQAEVDRLYNDITTIPESVADYSEFVEVFEMMTSLNSEKYTEDSYEAFIDEIYAINQNLPKNLSADEQATVDAAVDALYAAYNKLVSCHLNDDNVFTQDDISETGNSPFEFTVASNEYNFMQTVDGQKFAIRTDLTVRNGKSRYNCNLLSFKFSDVSADKVDNICGGRATPDAGCHNGENVLENQSALVLSVVEGVNVYSTADDAGDIGEHTTWVNTEGVALSTNGVLNNPTTLSTSDSSAYAEYYYTGASGNQETIQPIDVKYAFRIGWSYYETVLGITGDTVRRHAHIPVTVKITDARALHTLYNQVADILQGESDKNYTFDSLVNLYNAYTATDSKMANGDEYYTQDEVNAEYAALKSAFDSLQEGADYSEYFEAYIKAQELISTNNTDSKGNALYDEEVFAEFVETVTTTNDNLEKNLSATEENQAKVDTATNTIKDAIATLEASKRADYSALNDAMTEAEKILSAPEGTYTKSTLDALREAYNNATALDKTLPASEQATVDAVTSALEAALADVMYKADYSEFEDAYSQVQDIVKNPDNYSGATVEAAKKALKEADTLNKDLPDTADNRTTIETATDKLNDVLNNVEGRADYSEFDSVVDSLEEIVNNPDNYTSETVEAAKDALQNAEDFDKALGESQQGTVDSFVNDLKDVLNSANKKADYTDYNKAKAEADSVVNDDGNGNPIYDEDAFNAYKEAVEKVDNALSKDLSSDNQAAVDEATKALTDAKAELENNKKADYTDFNAAKDALEEIVNNLDKYTSETVTNAQTALDNANQIPDNLVVGENNVNQDMINKATQNMQDVVDSAEKKADYSEFDSVVDSLEEIVNNPDNYTSETVEAAKDALQNAEDFDKDLPESQQGVVDSFVNDLKDVLNSADKKADYTDYNNAKSEADSLVNDDGNGNPIYDEEAFEAYKDAVSKIDTALDKDLPESEQSKVDEATNALDNALNTLESSKYYTVTFLDAEGNLLSAERFVPGAVFGTIAAPQLPESTDEIAVVGWAYENDTIAGAEDVLTSDVTVKIASEDKVLRIIDGSGLSVDAETGYIVTEGRALTVADMLAKFDNDVTMLVIKDFEGNVLSSDDYVGSGAVITLESKYTDVVYEARTFVIYGDVTGDGLVNADDYAVARKANIIPGSYNESNYYFFVANDVAKDGYIDALDTSYINLMVKGYK